MTNADPVLAAKLLSELTRGGFLKGGGSTIDGRTVSLNTTLESSFTKGDAMAAIRTASPHFPAECAGLLEQSLVIPADSPVWGICLEFSDVKTARQVGQFEDLVKGYDRG